MDYRIISIGALSRHELWQTPQPPRTPHATTTLIHTQGRLILVDPGLPPEVIAARLQERAGLQPQDITDIFLTCFRPSHRWGLPAFQHADWFIAEAEREAVGAQLVEKYQHETDDQVRDMLKADIAALKRCKPAPDKLAPNVDLFPLPGYTPGSAGLLLLSPQLTTLVAGDAVATSEHLQQGRVLRAAYDAQLALESLREAIEIADVIIPGHDNIIMNPTRRPA